jgi:tetratricopeptide (TPR) repeat protein
MAEKEESRANGSDAAGRSGELMDRGVAAVRDGSYEDAHALLDEAEHMAAAAGLSATAIAAHINRGWALWVQGDPDGAAILYAEGAQMARDAKDVERLRVALTNLGVALRRLGRHDEAIAAYEEYLPHLSEHPPAAIEAHLSWGAMLAELGEHDSAEGHFEEAERLATEAEIREFLPEIRLNRGTLEEYRGAADAAITRYWDAYELASEMRLEDEVGAALIALGHAYARIGDHQRADACFAEAVQLFRSSGDTGQLADTLHAHARSLHASGRVEEAVAAWAEEAPIRRAAGDHHGLGDCLFQHIVAVRGRQEPPEMNLMFAEAGDAYLRAGDLGAVADVRYSHAQWLRGRELHDMARERVEQAVAAAEGGAHRTTESLARGLHAMVLADDGEFEAASAEAELAETAARESGEHPLVVGALARSAYVLACQARPVEEVVARLQASYDYAEAHITAAIGAGAVGDLVDEIAAECGRQYREPLRAFVEGLKQPREARDDGADAENDTRVP